MRSKLADKRSHAPRRPLVNFSDEPPSEHLSSCRSGWSLSNRTHPWSAVRVLQQVLFANTSQNFRVVSLVRHRSGRYRSAGALSTYSPFDYQTLRLAQAGASLLNAAVSSTAT